MSTAILMPGAGTVVRWHKRAGDLVIPGEPVATVAVNNQVQALRSPVQGALSVILVPAGRTAVPGQELTYVEPAMQMPNGTKVLLWDDLRRRIASHQMFSSNFSAHITTCIETDMSRVQALRRYLKERGASISITAFCVRAAAEALQEWPILNGQVMPNGAGVVLPDQINITVPVAVPGAVHLVVLRNAPQKSVSKLSAELDYLAGVVRHGGWGPQISDGGTFTVTNPGSLGSISGTTIINQPNTAILSSQAVVKRPVVMEGDRLEIRPMMNLCLSFDHRAVDGVVSLGFLNRVKELLQAGQFSL